MRVLIINNAESHIREFVVRWERFCEQYGSEFHTINYKEALNINHEQYDGIILSGSPRGNDIVQDHIPYFTWVKETTKPVLGVCAGIHIVGVLYGAHYQYSLEPEFGYFSVYIKQYDPIFANISNSFLTRQLHNDSITLPKYFIHLAYSDRCKIQAIKHSEKAIYLFQFHPEYINKTIITNFLDICKNQPS